MKTKRILAAFGAAAVLPALAAAQDQRPNFLIILSDDAGYGDFGFTGSDEFLTPNLDRLAREAIRFDRAYVSCPVSGPSRAGLLSGQYQQRYGFIFNNVPSACDLKASVAPEEMGLDTTALTIGDRFHEIGYKTIALGKWHQGFDMKYHPNNRGFDEFYGFLGGQRSYFAIKDPETEFKLWQNKTVLAEKADGYFTDMLADRASAYVEEMQEADQPFLMYLAFNAVHTPLHAKPEHLKKFSHLKGPRKPLAAMTWAMDEGIGKVIRTLKETGQYENTIIVFLNDNGGPSDVGTDNGIFSGCKATLLEGGIRVPCLMRVPKKYMKKQPDSYAPAVSSLDIIPTFLSFAGAEIPAELDGKDIRPYLNEPESRVHEDLFWFFDDGFKAYMKGDLKLIVMPDRPAELYDVVKDPQERHDLAPEQPELVREMHKTLAQWVLTMERPRWQLKTKYTQNEFRKYDKFRK